MNTHVRSYIYNTLGNNYTGELVYQKKNYACMYNLFTRVYFKHELTG